MYVRAKGRKAPRQYAYLSEYSEYSKMPDNKKGSPFGSSEAKPRVLENDWLSFSLEVPESADEIGGTAGDWEGASCYP